MTADRLTLAAAEAAAVCWHQPGPRNRWCDDCGALIIAGHYLTGRCGHERLFPPEMTWSPRGWCWACDGIRSFGEPPPRERRCRERAARVERSTLTIVSPFWNGDFHTKPSRPFSVLPLGLALARPNVLDIHRRLGTPWPRNWYRWRESGLTDVLADRLACNAGLHPFDVWGEQWWETAA